MTKGATTASDRRVVGRESELATVGESLGGVTDGPVGIVLHGEAGIGKTTVWEAAADDARSRGWRVLTSRPGASEGDLSFAGLSDLIGPVADEALRELPAPQRRAIEVALLREALDGDAPDSRSLGAATLGALRSLAAASPLVVAIDDAQWLDVATRDALRFAIRRLADEPIAFLVAIRATQDAPRDALDLERAIPPDRFTQVEVGPLPMDDLARLLRARLDLNLPRPAVKQVHRASAGNPFYALEIGRALMRSGADRLSAEPLPLPKSLRTIVEDRLSTLSDAALEVLLVAAAAARPTLELVRRAVADEDAAASGVTEAERAEIIAVGGDTLRFTHPLLASTVYSSTPVTERRALHRRLADLVLDPEERARHLGLAAGGPDLALALALETAAHSAQRRGATETAARLLEQAVTAIPGDCIPDRRRLLIAAGEAHLHSGSAGRAQELLREALPMCAPGTERAEALFQLAEAVYGTHGPRAAIAIHRQALDEPEVSGAVLAAIHRELSWYGLNALGDPAAAQEHARTAVTLAEGAGDPVLLMTALDYAAGVLFHFDLDACDAFRARGLELERVHGDRVYPDSRPSTTLAQNLLYADDLDQAQPTFERMAASADEVGDELGRCTPYFYLTQIEWRRGNWVLARRYAEEAYEIILQAQRWGELGSKLYSRALIYAHLGLMSEARQTADESLETSEANGAQYAMIRALGVIGFIELSLGRLPEARAAFDRATGHLVAAGIQEPGFGRWIPDHIETLVALGDHSAAEPLVAWLDERGRARNRPWAIASAARGRGLLLAAAGRSEEAIAELRRSAVLLEDFGQPFELARSLLALGTTERRANQRRAARDSLGRALGILTELPAPLWAERASGELARIGGRRSAGDELTPTEREIAEQVAAGLTNREVAERLFVAVRTVESNLSRIYAKLGVRSRTELSRHLREP